MPDQLLALHANTPDIAVNSLNGTVRALRFLREPGKENELARLLITHTTADPLTRTARAFGARQLVNAATGNADAITISTLAGQPLMLHTADGDITLTLSDAAGRPLWGRNAQGTTSAVTYEPQTGAGRPVSATEQPAGRGGARIREQYAYSPFNDEKWKGRNLAGAMTELRNNAGIKRFPSMSVPGQPLLSEECLLRPEMGLPDWTTTTEDDTEKPLIVSGTSDATGAPLSATNAARVTTVTAYNISGAVQEGRLHYTDKGEVKETVTLRDRLYRADGVVLSQTAGNGITEEYEYDSRTQYLTRHSVRRPANHLSVALLLSGLHYGYDPAGNILTLEDKGSDPVWHNNQQATGLRTYGYDTLYRLVSANGRERGMRAQHRGPLPRERIKPSAGSTWSPYEEACQYDDGDNLIKQTHTGVSGWTRTTAVSSRSNRGVAQESGQLPATDPHGAYLAGGLRKALDDGRQLAWDADGQLSRVTPVSREADEQDDTESYRYSDPGTRVRKVRMIKVAGGAQTAVTTYAGGCETRSRVLGSSVQLDIRVTEAGGMRVIHDGLKGEVHLRYGFADHQGSVSGETDSDGNVTSREEYYPYGGSAGSDEEAEETTDRTRRYSGKERDATGLLYYGWRYYQAESGRWLSADPGGLIDGANLFRFCRNNPVNNTDEDGFESESDIKKNVKKSYEKMLEGSLWKNGVHEGTQVRLERSKFLKSKGVDAVRDRANQNLNDLKKYLGPLLPQEANFISLLKNKPLEAVHFTNAQFHGKDNSVEFLSRDKLLKDKKLPKGAENNTQKNDIKWLSTTGFAFFSIDISDSAKKKSSSFFGVNSYRMPIKEVLSSDYGTAAHVQLNDTINYAHRPLVNDKPRPYPSYLPEGYEREYYNISINGQGVEPADLLATGENFTEMLGYRLVSDIRAFSKKNNESIYKFASESSENMSKVINDFYRPQLLVPRKVKIKGNFTFKAGTH